MTKKLLIVESPAKCAKIQGFLGDGWRVQATRGHIRALKENLAGIGFQTTWEPVYETIKEKADTIALLKRAAKGAHVYLGSDDDREGEAIAWHTCVLLGLDPRTTPRILFHEITETALTTAIKHAGHLDMNKVQAQQTRAMLDLLIGFTLSPCLLKGVGYKSGLSAGRCQTPALRILYERDTEIAEHSQKVSWRVSASSPQNIEWSSVQEYASQEEIYAMFSHLAKEPYTLTITDRAERNAVHQPPLPFITSSLQQEAFTRFHISPKITMRIAQNLYEAGHITYMRTDNAKLSKEAYEQATNLVKERWGQEYVQSGIGTGPTKKVQKRKKEGKKEEGEEKSEGNPEKEKGKEKDSLAQNAHEAIRPTHIECPALEDCEPEQKKLYSLIWNRTIQSVMAPEIRSIVKVTSVPTAKPDACNLTTEWGTTLFAGWKMLDIERNEEKERVERNAFAARTSLKKDTTLPWILFQGREHCTSPPLRYTEASLIKELEHRGIGRPSTYATLVETVLDRKYVEKITTESLPVTVKGLELRPHTSSPIPLEYTENRGGERNKLRTTHLGKVVIEWLLANFEDIIAYECTANMETQLDEIAKGEKDGKMFLTDTWALYKERYDHCMSPPPGTTIATGSSSQKQFHSVLSQFGAGYNIIMSKNGPLFSYTRGEKVLFAEIPATLSVATATQKDAQIAIEKAQTYKQGVNLGVLEEYPILKRKGPHGFYVTWKGMRMSCTEEEPFGTIVSRLLSQSGLMIDHQIGPYKIKKGPYGLFMYKIPTTPKKPIFVSIPDTTAWNTLTVEGATQLYNAFLKEKQTKQKASSARKIQSLPVEKE
jgi:DNA topoisomerase I